METIEAIQRFVTSYPVWARVLIGLGLVTSFLTLLLAPRTSLADRDARPNAGGYWLVIEGVETYGSFHDASVRVSVDVNGTRYIYPTLAGVEWLEVAPSMAPQKFKLPKPSPTGYEVQMQMVLRANDNTYDFKSVNSDVVTSFPFSGEYELYTVEAHTRAGAVTASVHYRISNQP
jgi:hypothetical protein